LHEKRPLRIPDEQFYDAVVLHWAEMLIHIADTPDQNYSYLDDQTPAPKLANLLGNGSCIIPALKRRKSAVKEGCRNEPCWNSPSPF